MRQPSWMRPASPSCATTPTASWACSSESARSPAAANPSPLQSDRGKGPARRAPGCGARSHDQSNRELLEVDGHTPRLGTELLPRRKFYRGHCHRPGRAGRAHRHDRLSLYEGSRAASASAVTKRLTPIRHPRAGRPPGPVPQSDQNATDRRNPSAAAHDYAPQQEQRLARAGLAMQPSWPQNGTACESGEEVLASTLAD